MSEARFSGGTALPNSGAAGAAVAEKDDGAEPGPTPEPEPPAAGVLPIELLSVATGTRCGAMREPAPDSESEKECGAAVVVAPAEATEPLLVNKGPEAEDEEGPCEVENRAAEAESAATRAADVDAEKEPVG